MDIWETVWKKSISLTFSNAIAELGLNPNNYLDFVKKRFTDFLPKMKLKEWMVTASKYGGKQICPTNREVICDLNFKTVINEVVD